MDLVTFVLHLHHFAKELLSLEGLRQASTTSVPCDAFAFL